MKRLELITGQVAIVAYMFIVYLSECGLLVCVTLPVDMKQLSSTSLLLCYPLLSEKKT